MNCGDTIHAVPIRALRGVPAHPDGGSPPRTWGRRRQPLSSAAAIGSPPRTWGRRFTFRGRPLPDSALSAGILIGIFLVICLMIFVTYQDISWYIKNWAGL